MRSAGLALLTTLLPLAPALPQDDPAVPGERVWPVNPDTVPRPVAVATYTAEPITIDGRLDEPAWSNAVPITDFIQGVPFTGMPASQRTVARVLYNAEHIYISAVCYDTGISGMMVAGLEHDFNPGAGDIFGVTLDTYLDRRNSFLFLVNPGGALRDEHTMNDSRNVNVAWDAVATIKTSVTDSAWIVELDIPLTTLRFDPGRAEQSWGMNMLRRVRRANESSYWAPLDRRHVVHRMSRAGTLTGLRGLRGGRNLKLKPFTVVTRSEGTATADTMVATDADAGADLKYGLTSGLTLDLTYRTDFSQTEVDQEQVNLTRFSLFFPERRDFFVENAGSFAFGDVVERNYRMGSSPQEFTLFHSRRIGLRNNRPLPILGGARVSGRMGRNDIGLLSMQTRATPDAPAENFAVARLRRNVFGNSDVGVIFLNRDPMGAGAGAANRSYGLDANIRTLQNLVINAYVAASDGADSTSDGAAARVSVAWRDPLWNTSAMVKQVEATFDPGIGFVRRRDMRQYYGTVGLHSRPRASWIQEVSPFVEIEYITNTRGALETRQGTLGVGVSFAEGGNFDVELRDQVERIADSFQIFSGVVIPPGEYGFREASVSYRSSDGRRLTGRLAVTAGTFWSGERRSVQVGATWRPRHDLFFEVSGSRNDVNLPQGDFLADLASARVRFAGSTKLFGSAFVQYNAESDQLVSNLRLDWRHAPLSDVFLVLVDRRHVPTRTVLERSVALKVTRLFAF
ncbi:MAG TPA: DUF5916 domain-containing protein [Gemmatimonadales bacterium]|nr:DUF5916 domain-containing protein [Gemmatimonadales bacterium]